jgi:hypothetical protein
MWAEGTLSSWIGAAGLTDELRPADGLGCVPDGDWPHAPRREIAAIAVVIRP